MKVEKSHIGVSKAVINITKMSGGMLLYMWRMLLVLSVLKETASMRGTSLIAIIYVGSSL